MVREQILFIQMAWLQTLQRANRKRNFFYLKFIFIKVSEDVNLY